MSIMKRFWIWIMFGLFLSPIYGYSLSVDELKTLARGIKDDTSTLRFIEFVKESVSGAINAEEVWDIFQLAYNTLEPDSAYAIFKDYLNSSNTDLLHIARFYAGKYYFDSGDTATALKYFEKTKLPEARFYIAQIFYNRGDYSRALQELTDLNLLRSDFQRRGHLLRAMCLEAMGNYSDALDQFTNMYIDSDYDTYHDFILYRIIKLYEKTGDTQKAAQYAQDYLRNYPNSSEAEELENKYVLDTIIQVAALSSEKRAKLLKEKVEELFDITAFIEITEFNGRKFYRVKAGPLPNRKAQDIAEKLNEKFDVKCRLLPAK